ncbi:MAG: HlyD family type I secretion periplasmic adaptor subunit [Rhodospirillales bacterium]|nr:HlyD family type I secretion periplasmic adaptor subunit [Rhodospirillales bacterium]MDE2199601.1 HlyD family type I secretion periplasmic adaptor subunit [Rhodospirillales bacterium]MDE2573879.1 HlyD family type I secretion periplasmic adaptor subunit [Rhodospirillales bacterium]
MANPPAVPARRGRAARPGEIVSASSAISVTDPAAPILLEFESPSAALLARPVPLRSRFVVWIIGSLFVATLVVAATLPIDRVVTTTGTVVATAPNIVVQPLETSIVRAINVKEGQFVKKGQVLARLDPTFATADEDSLKVQVASLGAEVARLTAEADGRPYVSDGTPPSELQAVIYAQRRAELSYKIETYNQKIQSLQVKVAQAQDNMKAYAERLALALTVEAKRRELERLQVGSQLNTLAAIDNRVEMKRGLETARTTMEGAQRDLDAMVAERDATIQQEHAQTSQQLTDQGRKLAEAQENLNKARLRHDLVVLRAERDAIVLNIAPVSVGSVMQTADQFMTLVPVDSPLEIETLVDGRDAGFVNVGDSVTIKFETFPYYTYGTARGVVRVLSPDSFHNPTQQRTQITKPRTAQASGNVFYRARTTIDEMKMHHLPPGFRLIPGMPVVADVKVGQRTVVQYLLSRVIPATTQGMREP